MIELKDVTKIYKVKQKKGFFKDLFSPTFREIRAVDNVSFSIKKGELIGFIGPNGAGKTTTIKMLTGILWPTKGEIKANGFIPYKQRKQYLMGVGVVFGQRKSLWPELSVYDNLDLIASFYKVKNVKQRIEELNQVIHIRDFLDQPFRKLSLGQQMRAELVAALIHKPTILYLDEPTIGMDVVAKYDFIQLLKSINKKQQTTIILTSHDLHEIESLCNRIVIINKGVILYDGDLQKIKPKRVTVQYEDNGKIKSRIVQKTKLKEFLATIDLNDIQISEIPLEEIVKKFYK